MCFEIPSFSQRDRGQELKGYPELCSDSRMTDGNLSIGATVTVLAVKIFTKSEVMAEHPNAWKTVMV